METKERTLKNTHHGHAVKRFRHALGIKQEVLADMMGITQARVSNYQSTERDPRTDQGTGGRPGNGDN